MEFERSARSVSIALSVIIGGLAFSAIFQAVVGFGMQAVVTVAFAVGLTLHLWVLRDYVVMSHDYDSRLRQIAELALRADRELTAHHDSATVSELLADIYCAAIPTAEPDEPVPTSTDHPDPTAGD